MIEKRFYYKLMKSNEESNNPINSELDQVC